MAVEQVGIDIAEKNNGTNALTRAVRELSASLKGAQSSADSASPANKRFGDSSKKASADVDGFAGAVKDATGSFSKFQGAVSAALGAMSVKKMIDYADTYTNLRNQLTLVTKTQADTTKAMNESFDIAQRSRTSYEETAKVYGKVTTALRAMNEDTSKAAGITETIAKAVALSGSSAEAASNGLRQFQQAMDSGVLRGEEFNSVMENTPGLARALAEGLGVPIGALRSMAEAGELTATRVTAALEKAGPKVSAAFAQTVPTVSQAFQTLENAAIRYIGEADKANGFTKLLSTGIIGLANNVNILIPALTILAGAVAVVGLGFLISQVTALAVGFTTLLASVGPLIIALTPFAPVIAAAAAAITAIILVLRAFGVTVTDVVNAVGRLIGMKTDLITKSNQTALAINSTATAAQNSAGQFNRYGEEVKGAGAQANMATDFLQNLVGAASDTNKSFGDLAGSTSNAKVNLSELNKEAQKTGDFYNQLGEKIYDASKAKQENASAASAATRSLNALGNQVRSTASANDNLRSSSDAATASIRAQGAAAQATSSDLRAMENAAASAAAGLLRINEVRARNAAIGGAGNTAGSTTANTHGIGTSSGGGGGVFSPDYSAQYQSGQYESQGGEFGITYNPKMMSNATFEGLTVFDNSGVDTQAFYATEMNKLVAGQQDVIDALSKIRENNPDLTKTQINDIIKKITVGGNAGFVNLLQYGFMETAKDRLYKIVEEAGLYAKEQKRILAPNKINQDSQASSTTSTTSQTVSSLPRPIQVIINTPDYNSFRRSEKQIQTDMLRNIQKAAS